MIKKYEINQILWNRLYSPTTIKRDTQIKKTLQDYGIEVDTFNAHLLNEPWEVQNNSGQYFKVFTPYWRKAFEVYQSKKEKLKKLESLNILKHQEKNSWNFLPKKNWYEKFANHWTPGEQAAQKHFNQYLKKDIDVYKEARDRPDFDQTSKAFLQYGVNTLKYCPELF